MREFGNVWNGGVEEWWRLTRSFITFSSQKIPGLQSFFYVGWFVRFLLVSCHNKQTNSWTWVNRWVPLNPYGQSEFLFILKSHWNHKNIWSISSSACLIHNLTHFKDFHLVFLFQIKREAHVHFAVCCWVCCCQHGARALARSVVFIVRMNHNSRPHSSRFPPVIAEGFLHVPLRNFYSNRQEKMLPFPWEDNRLKDSGQEKAWTDNLKSHRPWIFFAYLNPKIKANVCYFLVPPGSFEKEKNNK